MRDEEFTKVYRKLVPKLDYFFHRCLSNAGYKGSYIDIKRDLISCTGHDAFLDSRKQSSSKHSIKALIWANAGFIWYEFQHPRAKGNQELEEVEGKRTPEIDILHRMHLKELIKSIRSMVDDETWSIIEMRAAGYQYGEIAEALNASAGKIKMKLKRLKTKLNQQSLRFLKIFI